MTDYPDSTPDSITREVPKVESATGEIDPHEYRARFRLGKVIRQKWRLDQLLGVGGMAAVYLGTHRNGKRVAIKMLHAELSVDHTIKTRFLREGYVANRIEHEGAVSILDDDVAEDGSAFLVMELLEGETLEERAARKGGTLDPREALSIADQILDALAAAHDKGIVHRDLKPANLFLTRQGLVKILDFGIARLREVTSASTATKSGATMGTPAFMPPEQARGLWQDIDPRSDIWALGATLFTLLSGRLVHRGRTANETLLSAMTQSAPSLTSLVPIAPEVANLIDRALAYKKADRWPNARAMQEALRSAYHSMSGAPLSTAPKLDVPAIIADRTKLSAGIVRGGWDPRRPTVTTGGAVSAGRTGIALALSSGLAQWTSRPAVVVGIGIAIVGVLVAATIVATRSAPLPPTAVSAAASTVATTSPALANSVQSVSRRADVPSVSADDLPTASPKIDRSGKSQTPRDSPSPAKPTTTSAASKPAPATTSKPKPRGGGLAEEPE